MLSWISWNVLQMLSLASSFPLTDTLVAQIRYIHDSLDIDCDWMGEKTFRTKCTLTTAEVTFALSDPNELVLTQRKIDGRYQKVLKPRKEVKGSLNIRIDCREIDRSKPTTSYDPPNPWCKKRNNACPIYEIARTILRKKGLHPSSVRIDVVDE